MASEGLLLELNGIHKSFPGVIALSDVGLTLKPGEILGLVGENGAGKSTLVRIITGVYPRDKGSIKVRGREVEMRNPAEARHLHKIAYISQESSLCPDLSVAENIALGDWKHNVGLVGWKAMNDQAVKLLEGLQLEVDPRTLVKELRPADRQLVEIARALSIDAQILLMDEPTSWLSQSEKAFLFGRMNLLKEMGVGIIFISHFLDEVLTICDRVQVLRDGQFVGVFDKKDLTKNLLIEHMLGLKKLRRSVIGKDDVLGKVLLKVNGVSKRGQVEDISFEVRAGEIVGIAGLLGSGKSELARIVYGLQAPDKGEVLIDEKRQNWSGPGHSIDLGVGLITEDRKAEGIVPMLSMANNITLANWKPIKWFGFLSLIKEMKVAQKFIEMLKVNPPNPKQLVINLSGGNQQKVIIAKWLQSDSKVLILDEPTRGIDVGAKFEIYALLREVAKQGKAIIFISSELAEILEVPHRYLAFRKGRIVGEFKNGQIKDEHELLSILSA